LPCKSSGASKLTTYFAGLLVAAGTIRTSRDLRSGQRLINQIAKRLRAAFAMVIIVVELT
jgi:predicted CDP-diglyceride synthetase/phosphatidate cytidylyltransferase